MLTRTAVGAVFAVTTCFITAAGGPANADEGFYKDKQIRMVVGSGSGGGYDTFARVLVAHWPRHIPGEPTFIVTNMPGAGSLVAANHLANVAPKDGTAVGGLNPGIVDATLLFPKKAKLDPRNLTWIGSILRETQVATAWHTTGVKKLDDVFDKELIVAASGGATEVYPKLLNGLLGTKFRVVSGYKGTHDGFLAVERGEAQGIGGITWASLKATQSANLKAGKIIVIAQYGLEPHPDLPDVPFVLNYAKAPDDKAALQLMLARQEFGRPYAAPPGVPEDRVRLLRRSFDATMKDKGFREDITKRRLEVDPVTGEHIQKLIAELYETPPETVARVRKILAKDKK